MPTIDAIIAKTIANKTADDVTAATDFIKSAMDQQAAAGMSVATVASDATVSAGRTVRSYDLSKVFDALKKEKPGLKVSLKGGIILIDWTDFV